MLTYRKATEADMMLYFDWANDETVRKNSINTSKINFDDHVKWFTTKLASADSIFLIFLNEEKELGQLRLETDHQNRELVINFSIDSNFRGKGFGTEILFETYRFYTGLEINYPLIGFVKQDNGASAAAFLKAGFTKLEGLFKINNEEYLKFRKTK